eukprot:Selendium_serpulae@DN3473_c0_g1_i1.p1
MAARSAMLCGVVKDAVGSPLTQLGASIEEFVCVFDDGMTDAVLAQLPTPSVVRDANQLLLDEEAQPVAPLAAPLALPVKPLYTGITAINLNGCHNVTDAGLLTISRLCPKLARLEVYWNTSISDEGIAALCRAECGANLETLNLSGCQTLTDATAKAMALHCKRLRRLDVTRCTGMTDISILMFAERLPRLTGLNMYAWHHVKLPQAVKQFAALGRLAALTFLDLCGAVCGDDEISSIARGCPALQHLNLTWVAALADGGVTALAAGCAVLEWLSLHGNNKVTMAGLKALMAAPCAATIHSLDVRGCVHLKEVLDDDFKGLRTAFPKCTTFVLHT